MRFTFKNAAPIYQPNPPATPAKPDSLQMLRDVVNNLSLEKLLTEEKKQISNACKQIDEAFSHLNPADRVYTGKLRLNDEAIKMLSTGDFGERADFYKKYIPSYITDAKKHLEANELDRKTLAKVAGLKLFLDKFYELRKDIESEYREKHTLLSNSRDELNKENNYDNFKELSKAAGEVTSFAREVFPIFTQHALPFDKYYVDFNIEELHGKFSPKRTSQIGLGDLYSLIVIIGQGLRRSGFSEGFVKNHGVRPVTIDQYPDNVTHIIYEDNIKYRINTILTKVKSQVLNKTQVTGLLEVLGLSRMYFEHRTKLLTADKG